MVLESFINPKIDHTNFLKYFFVGMVYTAIACGIALLVFPSQSSIVSVFLVVLACAPFVYHMLEREEIKELEIHTTRGLLAEYGKIIRVLLSLFFGMVTMYAILAFFLKDSSLFLLQIPIVSGAEVPTSADFFGILANNSTVLLISIMFSFFFSMGAIFVLAWNASVLGTAIGVGVQSATTTFGILVEIIRYLPHGIFEFGAYFIAGVGGSFISFGMLHEEYLTHKFSQTLKDGFGLFLISFVMLILAAVIEVFVVF